VYVPESLKRQNELIRTLRKQLEATERELESQKWLFDQYLQSPSWRVTAPLRWIARQLRAVKQSVSGGEMAPPPTTPKNEIEELFAGLSSPEAAYDDLKQMYTALGRLNLEAFLASNAVLEIPASPEPEVSIIVVVFNRAELTLACLRSIRENVEIPLEVVVADNASSDDTSKLLGRTRGVRVIRNAENLHFLQAVNQSAREARGKFILLLNNDAQLLPGALKAALQTIKTDENIGAVGGRIILMDGSLQEAGSIVWRDGSCLGYGRGDNPFSSTYMFRRDVDYCSGAFLLTPRAVWEKLGGFDETFKPAYYEETDYCMRLWEQGLRVVYDPCAVILHYEFASSDSTANAISLQSEHKTLFAQRHAGALQKHFAADPQAVLWARVHSGQSSPKGVLFIDDQTPHGWLGSGFPRARTILLSLVKRGLSVTLFPMVVLDEEWATVYSDVPRDIEVINDMGLPLLEAFLRNRSGYYDTMIISRPHNMKIFRTIFEAHPDWFEKTRVIYDAEAFLAPRQVASLELAGTRLAPEEIAGIYQKEALLASCADCVVAVSETDQALFRKHGVSNAEVLGHKLEAAPTSRPFEQRNGFLFIGSIHEDTNPNGDSMIWFLSEIWPRIQDRLGGRAVLTVIGINKSERVKSMAGPGVRLLGRVDDVTEHYEQTRVFIAPTRFAAGLPHKVHEAAARGVPAVTTPVLARQLGWRDGVEIAVGADAAEFAKKCIQLHSNETLWMRTREAALDAIRRECAPDLFEERLSAILASIKLRNASLAAPRS
jgi:GT2 family glycosyltransferase